MLKVKNIHNITTPIIKKKEKSVENNLKSIKVLNINELVNLKENKIQISSIITGKINTDNNQIINNPIKIENGIILINNKTNNENNVLTKREIEELIVHKIDISKIINKEYLNENINLNKKITELDTKLKNYDSQIEILMNEKKYMETELNKINKQINFLLNKYTDENN